MRALILQHVPFEGPGSIASWLSERDASFSTVHLYTGELLPDLDSFDLLIIMGGPMSVNDESDYPWLSAEKDFIHNAIKHGKSVLGVCLGAQLIASALGAEIRRNPVKEIGWYPIEGIPSSRSTGCFAFPTAAMVFHWHGETFALPDGSVQLARSKACEQQAFQYGRRTLGLQFHLEMTPTAVQSMLSHAGSELHPAPWIQTATDIGSHSEETYASNYTLLCNLLDYLIQAD